MADPKAPVRIVLLEDNAEDATLIIRELNKTKLALDVRWILEREGFLEALATAPDLVLSDYRLPGYSGLAALADVRSRWPEAPFIILSGALGDEAAADCIKSGVTDYLLKDRMSRLGSAVRKALDEQRLRADRRSAEEQMRQSQKMEAVGRLAGGIAHDFNNLLTAINGWTELLLETEPLSDRATKVLKEIAGSGERAMRLTQQLLLFSRKRPPQRQPLDLNGLVANVAEMLRRLIGAAIALEIVPGEPPPVIEGDSGMIEQVLVNLAVNARDAINGPGRIRIELRAADRGRAMVGSDGAAAAAGDYVRLTVRDDGCGIPPDIQTRMFEPFFTTKEAGKGSGMGLSTVHGIVQQHQGWIEVESRLGVGTAIHVFLPLLAGSVPRPGLPVRSVAMPPGQGETVLVVEDEATVRHLARAALTQWGYQVISANTGKDALAIWKRREQRIDLLMTDVVMPDGMTGVELMAAVRADEPNLPVLLTSGYHEEAVREGYRPAPGTQFLHKPYSLRVLAGVLRQLIDSVPRNRLEQGRDVAQGKRF